MNMSEIRLWADTLWSSITDKTMKNSQRIGDGFPHVSVDGAYQNEGVGWWTNGFWPGLLWLVFRENRSEQLARCAAGVEEKLDVVLHDIRRHDHDMGFRWSLSAVARYRLTGDVEARARGLMAANALAGRYNLRGQYIRAFDQPGREGVIIIDTLMNLPLLHWASDETGDPRFRWVAIAHADTALKELIRQDGSTHHAVSLNAATGAREEAIGGQGAGPDSAWSRGTAWALYGMALAYRETGEVRYLDAARRAAHFFMAALPEDGVPYWDFRVVPDEKTLRDSSASACAASGLLLLAELVPPDQQAMYASAAVRLLRALEQYCLGGVDEEGLLTHATGNKPANKHMDVPIIYGDYFFAEALARLRGHPGWF